MILNYFSRSYDLIAQKINIKASHNYRFSYAYIGFMFLPQPNYIIFGEKKKKQYIDFGLRVEESNPS